MKVPATLAAVALFVGLGRCGERLQADIEVGLKPDATYEAACDAPFTVGLRIASYTGGRKMAVWYPSAGAESKYAYSKDLNGSVVKNGPTAACGRFPLVVFSHGFGGCGMQSVFFTEELARRGYVVAAPDHQDAGCSVEGKSSLHFSRTDQSLFSPEKWDEKTEIGRRDDVRAVVDALLEDKDLSGETDVGRIGMSGHSLGGYVALAMAGAWENWTERRFKAALMFSPYVAPFVEQHRPIANVVPVMYQGAQFDLFITPSLRGERGIFAQSRPPKYYLELKGGNHFEWTNLVCLGKKTIASCLESKANARLIDDYGIAFLDAYLKGDARALARLGGSGAAAYRHDP
jgi:dienelactone hydrolase